MNWRKGKCEIYRPCVIDVNRSGRRDRERYCLLAGLERKPCQAAGKLVEEEEA